MVFGLNALVTKPAISFAPMITVALLGRYGYNSVPSQFSGVSTTTLVVMQTPPADGALTYAMFCILCAVPVIIGLLQLLLWQFYTIRDSHKSLTG